MYSNILLAVDGSDNNKIAANAAIDVAKAMGAKLTAIYVVSGVELKPNAFGGDVADKERLEIAEKQVEEATAFVKYEASQKGVPLEVKILQGNPGDEIVKASSEFDLLVCGSLGRTGLAKALMGSVSSTITKNAHCAVLVCRS